MPFPLFTCGSTDSAYPPLLKETVGGPALLYARGALPRPEDTCVAIVGTRKATKEGMALARETGETLARKGIVVVSGLALGIDGAAHEGALRAGGRTAAVLANGLDSVYPRQHEQLAKRILEGGGCLISEYPEGTPSYPSQFLARNRIVSGLSVATVVIEAPLRSGSLATARNAIEQGREVFIFPGDTRNRNYAGSHALIRTGARLVTSAEDILEDLGFASGESSVAPKKPLPLDTDEAAILALLHEAREALSVDRIIEATGLPPNVIGEKLTLLLLEDMIEESSGSFRALR
jgi:DNA processing protein